MSTTKITASEFTRLHQAREARGLTLKQLSEATNYAVSTINEVEHGEHRPSERFWRDMLLALGLNPAWLFRGEGEMFASTQGYAALLRERIGMLRVQHGDVEGSLQKLRLDIGFLGGLITDVEKLIKSEVVPVNPSKGGLRRAQAKRAAARAEQEKRQSKGPS